MRMHLGCMLGIAMAACSSSSAAPPASLTNDAGPDGALPGDGGAAEDAPAADTGPASVNGCTAADFAANDHTAPSDPRIIQAPIDKTPAQFSPRCMRVRVDQLVTWQGDLADHSLDFKLASDDRDGGVFIASVGAPDGAPNMDTILARQPGTVAVTCEEHPTVMFGAVEIVP